MTTPTFFGQLGRRISLLLAGVTTLTAVSTGAGGGPLVARPAAADPYANPAFERVWARTDWPVYTNQAARTWIWGQQPLVSKQEKYLQGVGGTHLVQYFDKSRMEINDPTGDRNSPWYVTNGLLVVELMRGAIQTGNNEFEQGGPANIAVAGDTTDPAQSAPTYASMANVASLGGEDHTAEPRPIGAPIRDWIDRNGTVAPNLPPSGGRDLATVATYAPETRHNIADVFWSFLHSQGTIFADNRFQQGPLMNWVFVMGYPITEPYWTTIRVGGGDRQVLVQAFQRRVLTYSPTNPPGWQVEMGNVGLHYYSWRYEQPRCQTVPVRGFGTVWAKAPETAQALGCPLPWQTEQSVPTAVEPFQHGIMLYVGRTNTYPYGAPSIFVFFDDGTYQHFEDTYIDGQPPVCNPPAPAGLYTPQLGFNKVWCEGTGARVRERLGWAQAPEKSGPGAWQQFERGLMYWTGATNQIFVVLDIYAAPSADRHWQVFADTFNP